MEYRLLKMKRKYLLAFFILVSSILLSTFGFYFYQMFRSPNLQVGKEATDIYIPSNASFQTLIDSLKQKDAIGNVTSFAFLAKMLGYQEKVKSGKYRLQKNMNNCQE